MKVLASGDEEVRTPGVSISTIDKPVSLRPIETDRQCDKVHGQLVTCRLDELHPHPSYVRHHITVPASKLSTLAERGDLRFESRS